MFYTKQFSLEIFIKSHYLLIMTLSEIPEIFQSLDTKALYGCDSSAANIFLYQSKEQISFEYTQGVFFRFYGNSQNKKCAFPIPSKNAPQDYLYNSINYLLNAYKNIGFCLCTQEQKNQIDALFAKKFPKLKINWESDRAESDYIYLQQNLAELYGQTYQKKKNHVLHFLKTYENQWNFVFFDKSNVTEKIKDDILTIEQTWFKEKNGETSKDLQEEQKIIKTALENLEILNITGGIIYIQQKPVAMTMASPISETVLDIHFEKSLAEPAKNGAYAAINQFFAQKCTSFKYLNREEDLGILGLRKAKLSYKPQIILDKFSGRILSKYSIVKK